ncbi:hypothetical protein BH11GEM1_BH11GEM1_18730 [soil metagenome]
MPDMFCILRLRAIWALLVASASGVACGGDASSATSAPLVTGSPAVASAKGAMPFTAGVVAAYDATKGGAAFTDPAKGGLTYAITISAPANGLTSSGGTITGTPLAPWRYHGNRHGARRQWAIGE